MQKKGFTLIELLVVIAIIGLLATLAVVSYESSRTKSRDTKRKQDLRAMQKALEIYYMDNNSYPDTAGAFRGACAVYGPYPTSGPTGYIQNLAPRYISVLPLDPKPITNPNLCYLYRSDGQQYKILAHGTTESRVPDSDPFYDIPRSASQNTYGLCYPPGSTACASW